MGEAQQPGNPKWVALSGNMGTKTCAPIPGGLTGLLKRHMLQPFETCCFFNTKIQGSHHLQGNVQVYNVRIRVSF